MILRMAAAPAAARARAARPAPAPRYSPASPASPAAVAAAAAVRARLARVRVRPSTQPDPNMGGFLDSIGSAITSAASTAYHTTVSSISIPTQTVGAILTGHVDQVPSLLHQAAGTIPYVGNVIGGVIPGGSSSPAPAEATGSSTATLQTAPTAPTPAQVAAATQGLVPGSPQYAAALASAGFAPAAPSSNLPLYLGGAGLLLAIVLLLRPRAPSA